MYVTTLHNIHDGQATGKNGETLAIAGNFPYKDGDAVWTDGRIVYGWTAYRQPTRMWYPRGSGILYYDYDALKIYEYPNKLFADGVSADCLIDGEAATWLVLGDGSAVSLSTGLMCPYMPGNVECVTPAGELLSWWWYQAAQGAGGLYILSTVTDKENKQVSFTMRENISFQEKCADMLAAAQGYAAEKFAGWCPVEKSSGWFTRAEVTIHPDGSATARMTAMWGIEGERIYADCPKKVDLNFWEGYSGDQLDDIQDVDAEEDVLCSFDASATASVDFVMDTLTGNREFHRHRTWSGGYTKRENKEHFYTIRIRYIYSAASEPSLSGIEDGLPARLLTLLGVSFSDYMEPPSHSKPAPPGPSSNDLYHSYTIYNGDPNDKRLIWGCVDLVILQYPEVPYPSDGGGDFGTWNSFDWRLDHATARVDFLDPEWGGTTVCSLWGISEDQGYMLTDAYTMKDGTRLVVAWGKRGYGSYPSGKLYVIGKDGTGILCKTVANSRVAYCKNLSKAKGVLAALAAKKEESEDGND